MSVENLYIKRITPLDTYVVRHPILRAGRPVEDCHFNGDHLDSTLHYGIFKKKQLVGVTSFFKSNNSLFSKNDQYQLRGMAILSEFQGTGLGHILLNYGEDQLKKLNTSLIWCNARETALPFYEKQGYLKTGEPFEIKGIGTHYVMYKKM